MKKHLLLPIAALCILFTGCVNDKQGDEKNAGSGILKVTVKGYEAEDTSDSRAIGTPTQADENTVKSFAVYVFNNANGVLEKTVSFAGTLTGTISGLSTAFPKKVVVLVNQPSTLPTISKYGDFELAANMLSLDSQVPGDFSTQGLFMSGEVAPVSISPTATSLTVPVKRIVSKVVLGSLTVNPDEGLSLEKFDLAGVSIQQARDYSPLLGGLATTGFKYVGGLAGSKSSVSDTPKAYLHEGYSLPTGYVKGTALTPNIYFYVFPHDNADGAATMMALYGTYDGMAMYFPFQINDKVGTLPGDTSDASYITRNKIYVLHVALKKIGTGANDPDIPNKQVDVQVTVEVQDWDGTLVQHVEW